MIRSLLLSILFFFGPTLLMFLLRHLVLMLRFWLLMRKQKKQDEIIDITPVAEHRVSVWFVLVAIIVGLLSAFAAWHHIAAPVQTSAQYVPAHIDAEGNFIDGHYLKPKTQP